MAARQPVDFCPAPEWGREPGHEAHRLAPDVYLRYLIADGWDFEFYLDKMYRGVSAIALKLSLLR